MTPKSASSKTSDAKDGRHKSNLTGLKRDVIFLRRTIGDVQSTTYILYVPFTSRNTRDF